MKSPFPSAFFILAALLFLGGVSLRAETPAHGIVASVHPLATEAGLRTLKEGGNAIDAAVAVGLTLGVVDTQNSGLGGGCFLLIHLAHGENVCLDGRETAPAAAGPEMFVRNGQADPALSQTGALAIGVPGETAAFEYALQHFGKKHFAELLLPAADLAEHGFPLTPRYARAIRSVEAGLRQFPGSAAIFLPNDRAPLAGELFRQPELAKTYRLLAENGAGWFYRGPFAQMVESWSKANGGLIEAADLASYHVEVRAPISTAYRSWEIVSFPPPSSGGVHVLQILNILEHFDLKALSPGARAHVTAEAMKLAFADRAYWLGDPDFAPVPRGLISKKYAADLAHAIDPDRARPVTTHGRPPDSQTDLFKKHTTHFCTADAEGNWVSCTATINTTFGSKVVIPGTGVTMNNQMDDFSIQPGVPNAFGLVGAEANAVAPGKRPLSSMSPTIVFQQGKPIVALGAAGGPRIITAVVQELIELLDLGQTPAEAVAAPRIHQQWSPDQLFVEASLPAEIKADLTRRGHHLSEQPAMAVSQIIARSPDGQGFVGAADPRAGGAVDGW